ncbi:MAG TPA: hypothetical protein VNB49_10190 [Candidatus Dormibacteraeota bacterium]|nr:hypothetical protein [Candidatus Dormibacteraeota bacterium]
MKMLRKLRQMLLCTAVSSLMLSPVVSQETVAQLQVRFDRETNSVRKAKLFVKLGDAQFDEARRAGREGDNATVGFTMEKYRDNVRTALEALKKQHADAEKHSNGYRQMEMHVKLGIREVEDSMLAAPAPYKPPLQIVRQDLIAMDDELIRLLFPHRPADTKPNPPPEEKQA